MYGCKTNDQYICGEVWFLLHFFKKNIASLCPRHKLSWLNHLWSVIFFTFLSILLKVNVVKIAVWSHIYLEVESLYKDSYKHFKWFVLEHKPSISSHSNRMARMILLKWYVSQHSVIKTQNIWEASYEVSYKAFEWLPYSREH